MRDCVPLLYFDNQDHTWRFYVKDSGELVYSIMYEEDKWTKESKIDSEVLDFVVNVDGELRVYIIYSIKTGQLKYCIWKNNQWFGKTLYGFENQGYQIREITVNAIGKYMHILFLAKNSNNKTRQCALIHFCFNNEENIVNNIYNISLMRDTYSHYQTEVLKDGSLYLLSIHRLENEVAFKFTEYKDGKWSVPKRLYGINGSNVNFCSLQHNNKINILNLSKENSTYSLEHVLIEEDGKMKSNKIHESSIEFKNYLLLEIDKKLWAMWSEEKKKYISVYKNKWSEPILYGDEINEEIQIHKYLSLNNKYKNLKAKFVITTMPPDIRLLLPTAQSDVDTGYSLENIEKNIAVSPEYNEEKNIKVEDELVILKKTNKTLEKRVIDLQLLHQQKKRIIEEADDNFIKLANLKKRAEEKLKIINELHEVSIRELEVVKNQKAAVENLTGELKNKLKQLIIENEQLKQAIEEIKKQKLTHDNVVGELRNKLKELNSENEQLKIELKYEDNKGIMDRIMKKKLDR